MCRIEDIVFLKRAERASVVRDSEIVITIRNLISLHADLPRDCDTSRDHMYIRARAAVNICYTYFYSRLFF